MQMEASYDQKRVASIARRLHLIEQFRIAFSRHQRPFQALKCSIGAPWGITTPQRSHSESLRSSFGGQIFEVRKNLGGCTSPVCGPCSTVWTRRCDTGGIYCAQVCLWYHVDVGDSLSSHKSKPQLLKRKWSEDMTQNVRRGGENFGLRRVPVANFLMIPKASYLSPIS